MKCDRAREVLWPPERPRMAGDEVLDARRHVDHCPDCQEFLSLDQQLRERLRSLPRPRAPRELRERVFQALARERARKGEAGGQEARGGDVHRGQGPEGRTSNRLPSLQPRGSTAQALGMAAVLVGLFLGGWYLTERVLAPNGPPLPPAAHEDPATEAGDLRFVETFVQGAVPEERIVSSDPEEVSAFLAREVGLGMEPRSFQGFQLMGAEVCVLDDKRGAVFFYERNGQVLYHFVIEHDEVVEGPPTPSSATPHRWSGSVRPAAVVWSGGVRDEALVGDVPVDELLAMVREDGPGP